MRDSTDATTAAHFPARRPARRLLGLLIACAPGPEAPDSRDKAGAQMGMLILIGAGAAFWAAVAALAIYLLR